MPPSNSDAHQSAAKGHAGHVDRAEKPYIRNVNRVAASASTRAIHAFEKDGLNINPYHVLQAAYLHDVLENMPATANDLLQTGYAPQVVRMVQLLPKTDEVVSYAERIGTLIQSGNIGASLIKLSDNESNARAERQLSAGTGLTARYATSMPRLRDAASVSGSNGR